MAFTGPIEDRMAIRETLDSYCDAVNQRDADAWAATWAEDSVWNLTVIPGMEEITGKENIVNTWKQAMEMFPFVFMAGTVGSIEVNGETALARTYTAEVAITTDENEIRPRGQYDDELIKENGSWLFKRRTFKSLHGE